jgi:PIN domain nuclease of toxin-antitoxin system
MTKSVQLLLDTHVLLWWLNDDPSLTEEHKRLIQDKRNACYVSAATVWEISIKSGLGKLRIAKEYLDVLRSQGFLELPVSWAHTSAVQQLPEHHRDPFDRLLVAQAAAEGMVLLSVDPLIRKYQVNVL